MSAKLLQFLFINLFFWAPGFVATAQEPGLAAEAAMPEADTLQGAPASDSTDLLITFDSPELALASDTLHDVGKKQAVDAPVNYNASDSTVYSIQEQKVYLYGEATIQYKEITLNADYIEFNMGNEAVFARGP